MKKLFYTLAAGIPLLFFSCNSQNDAQKKAKEISNTIHQSSGTENPGPNGSYLKATIDGEKWEATTIGPFYGPESNYKLVSGKTNDININFQIHKPTTGLKRKFDNENMANFTTEEDFFSGKKGEVTIIKADDKWIEGTFYFSASSEYSRKVYEVTNGLFRIPVNYP